MAGNWGNSSLGQITKIAQGNLGQSADDGANLGSTWRSKADSTEGLIKGGAGDAQRAAHSGLSNASVSHANNVSLVGSSWNKGEQAQAQTIDEHGSLQKAQASEALTTDTNFKKSITG